MRYWAYMNNQVLGPFEKEKLPGIPGFNAASLICPETASDGGAVSWKAASACPEVAAVLAPAPAPAAAPRPRPEAESPLAMTMRGTLIDEPAIEAPAAARAPVPAAESPLAMTMRGTLIEETASAPAADPVGQAPRQEQPAGTVAEIQARLDRLESAVAEIKALLTPPPPKKG